MGEIKKIEFEELEKDIPPASTKNLIKPMKKRSFRIGKLSKRQSLIALGVLIFVSIGFVFGVVFPAQRAIASANKTYKQSRKMWEAIKVQNITLASKELAQTKLDLEETQKSLRAFGYVKFVPLLNSYYNDADHLVQAGRHGLDTATIIIDSIEPYADVLGLKGQGSFTGGSAEQRIQTAILTLGKITPRIDAVADNLVKANAELEHVDPNHYPGIFGLAKYKKQLEDLKLYSSEGVTFVNEARPLIKVLPSLLGEKEDKKYLVLFQNDKELRPTGGFITAYAVFRVEKGIIHVDTSEDIYTLDDTIRNKPQAPAGLKKYLPKTTVVNLRDSNTSPDFVESMKIFNEMYENSSGFREVDGIIALDTNVLVSTIKILDDEVQAAGLKFTTKNDKRCDCPQVIYELEDNISRPVNYVRTGRKDLLGALLYAIMEKALKSSPRQYWGPLIQDAIVMANQKHILFYLYDKDAQSGIESLNAAGRIRDFEGDYFHMNDANLGGAKSNLYVKQNVEKEYEISSDGTITKTVVFTYKNDHAPSDCNLERGGLCLNATNRDWFRIYVPKGSQLIESQGSEVKMSTYEDLNKTVFEGFLTVRPLGQKKLIVKYKLPFKLADNSVLPLMIQKQPGTTNNGYVIKMNGRTREEFELLTDKEFNLKK